MVEEWRKVSERFQMMHVVFRSTTNETEREQIVQAKWKVEPNVGFYTHDNTQNHVGPGRHWMAFKEP